MENLLDLEPPAERPGTPTIPALSADTDPAAETKIDPDQFDWSTDDSVLLGEQFTTAVYRNKRGAIVIRQEGVGGDDDHFVILRDAEATRQLVEVLHREIAGC